MKSSWAPLGIGDEVAERSRNPPLVVPKSIAPTFSRMSVEHQSGGAMIRHIVVFQLASTDPDTRLHHVSEIRSRLEALADVVPGVISIEVREDLGIVSSHWPLVLISDFESQAALDQYQVHPRHRAVVEWMNDGIVVDRVVIDYAHA